MVTVTVDTGQGYGRYVRGGRWLSQAPCALLRHESVFWVESVCVLILVRSPSPVLGLQSRLRPRSPYTGVLQRSL